MFQAQPDETRFPQPLVTSNHHNPQQPTAAVVQLESDKPRKRRSLAAQLEADPRPVPTWPSAPTSAFEIIDAAELARRWHVPQSWVEDRTRARAIDKIPFKPLGRYVRFEWVSPELHEWWTRQARQGASRPRRYCRKKKSQGQAA